MGAVIVSEELCLDTRMMDGQRPLVGSDGYIEEHNLRSKMQIGNPAVLAVSTTWLVYRVQLQESMCDVVVGSWCFL